MVGELLDSLGTWPLTEVLGWTAAQVQALMDRARSELQDVRLKLHISATWLGGGEVVGDDLWQVR